MLEEGKTKAFGPSYTVLCPALGPWDPSQLVLILSGLGKKLFSGGLHLEEDFRFFFFFLPHREQVGWGGGGCGVVLQEAGRLFQAGCFCLSGKESENEWAKLECIATDDSKGHFRWLQLRG